MTVYGTDGSVKAANGHDGDVYDYANNWFNLEKGTYYIKVSNAKSGVWYEISNGTEKTDLTNDLNVQGTVFEGYKVWEPMNTMTNWDEGYDILKITLKERSRIEFRCDDFNFQRSCVRYDSNGRRFWECCINGGEVDEWDAGTYFLIMYGYKNLYYVLSAPQNATSITISSNKISLSVGEKKKLTSKIEPSNCIDTVSWKSTDTNIATVKNDGTITGVSAGTCVVQATTGSGKAALCEVTVTGSKSSGTKSNSASKIKKTMKLSNVKIKKGSKKITGKISVKNTTVKVKIGSGKYKKAKVKGKKFTVKTKKLKKGKKITIKVTKSGYKSLTKKYKVR